ncbi:hypothetical protein ES703_93806 [subsurface metagenome]
MTLKKCNLYLVILLQHILDLYFSTKAFFAIILFSSNSSICAYPEKKKYETNNKENKSIATKSSSLNLEKRKSLV